MPPTKERLMHAEDVVRSAAEDTDEREAAEDLARIADEIAGHVPNPDIEIPASFTQDEAAWVLRSLRYRFADSNNADGAARIRDAYRKVHFGLAVEAPTQATYFPADLD